MATWTTAHGHFSEPSLKQTAQSCWDRWSVNVGIKEQKYLIYTNLFMTSSGKTHFMEEQKEQALIRRRAFCAVSDQSHNFLSHISICRVHFSRFLQNSKTIYEYKHMEKANLGYHCLLFHKPGFCRWHQILDQLAYWVTLDI